MCGKNSMLSYNYIDIYSMLSYMPPIEQTNLPKWLNICEEQNLMCSKLQLPSKLLIIS